MKPPRKEEKILKAVKRGKSKEAFGPDKTYGGPVYGHPLNPDGHGRDFFLGNMQQVPLNKS